MVWLWVRNGMGRERIGTKWLETVMTGLKGSRGYELTSRPRRRDDQGDELTSHHHKLHVYVDQADSRRENVPCRIAGSTVGLTPA